MREIGGVDAATGVRKQLSKEVFLLLKVQLLGRIFQGIRSFLPVIYTGFDSRNGAVILLVWTTNINYSGASFLYFTDLDFFIFQC